MMPKNNFIKENFVLIMGIALPMLLMVFFFVAAHLPQTISDPPQYDMIFAVKDYSGGNKLPVSLNLVVKEGKLKAQYVSQDKNYYNQWRKLYLFEAKTKKVRELSFGYPENMDKIKGMKEETVAATKNFKLDTTVQSPDGWELSHSKYSRSGLMSGLFWGGYGSRGTLRLRKGSASIPIQTGDRHDIYYYNAEFLGWVMK